MQREDRFERPEGIGPHEGHEFDLMRKGTKDVALFFEIQPDGLDDILAEGFALLKFPQFEHGGIMYYTRIVYRMGFEGAALRLRGLVEVAPAGIDVTREHEIGKILSYTPDQVDAFIDHAKHSRP